jgi:hypothetical protein
MTSIRLMPAVASANVNLTDANPAAQKNGLAHLVAHGGLYVEQLKAVALVLKAMCSNHAPFIA